MSDGRYTREELAEAVSASATWAEAMRRLGLNVSGGQRRAVQKAATEAGLDASHFKKRSPWRKYPDTAIAEAVAASTTLREVAERLGARPATGTLSHIRRRIAAAGMDVSHMPALNRPQYALPFTAEELHSAAPRAKSLRGLARALGVPDDSRSRAALGRMLREHGVDVTHFTYARVAIPETDLRKAVADCASYADVLRALGLPTDDANWRRVQRRTVQLGLDTSHFTRRSRRATSPAPPRRIADKVLRRAPEGSPRTNHARLRRALDEIGRPYACARCGNPGTWHGARLTLQIDHVNGDWRDDRRENLRYLCPNCHAVTDTWCGRNRRRGSAPAVGARQ